MKQEEGPLAGPVVAAAVILTAEQSEISPSKGLKDSKKLSPPKRETLFEMICESGVDVESTSCLTCQD